MRMELEEVLRRQLTQQGWSSFDDDTLFRGWDGYYRFRHWELWQVRSEQPPQGLRAWLLIDNYSDTDPYSGSVFDRYTVLSAAAERPADGESWTYVCQVHVPHPTWDQPLNHFLELLGRWRSQQVEEVASPAEMLRRNPLWLLPLRNAFTERKWRLFACACLRCFPELQEDEASLHAVALAEQYADGKVRKRELRKARKHSPLSWLHSFEAYDEAVLVLQRAARALPAACHGVPAALLNDLHPRAALALRAVWLRYSGGIVPRLARLIYDTHTFADLPILADALEEAGCTSADILGHLRGPGPHGRGCQVLDRILGLS
jgi:hypothetical protein